jgi:hypothetical protein
LYPCGFKPQSSTGKDGMQSLRIYTEHTIQGRQQLSKFRAEIDGIDSIREYCLSNDLNGLVNRNPRPLRFVRKAHPYPSDSVNPPSNMVFYEDDYNAKIVHQIEETLPINSELIQGTIRNWKKMGKMFRHMNRVRFEHPDIPLFIDMSIVKTNKANVVRRDTSNYAKRMFRPTDIQSAGIFDPDIPAYYEIEIEFDNTRIRRTIQAYDESTRTKYLMDLARKGIQLIIGGLQQSFYPIKYTECSEVIRSYVKQIYGQTVVQESIDDFKPNPKLFIGPNSVTLQIENVVPTPGIENIQDKFCVTDKADGQRAILYIHENCRVYLIDGNMNVRFTGITMPDTKWSGIMLDGEHIRHIDKNSMVKRDLYAAFDVYFYRENDRNGSEIVDVRPHPFINIDGLIIEEKEQKETSGKKVAKSDVKSRILYRYPILQRICEALQETTITMNSARGAEGCYFTFKCKKFEVPLAIRGETIFTLSRRVLEAKYEYEIDGLIYTPCHLCVGMYELMHEFSTDEDSVGQKPPNQRSTWELSFKWKPPHQNTIDFWVRVDQDKKTGKDVITSKMEGDTIVSYKTLILCCTFVTSQDEIADPFHKLVSDSVTKDSFKSNFKESNVKGMPFIPTQPYDRMAPFCYQPLKSDNAGRKYMLTEEGQIFHDNMIVEFQYDKDADPGWRWKPLRVRYDKTAQMLSTGKYFGNSFRVANANWHSIHVPVTREVITTGLPADPITLMTGQDDDEDSSERVMEEVETDTGKVYYQRKATRTLNDISYTKQLRDFHNYVKNILIYEASAQSGTNPTLIDYSVGKAGDLYKWKYANVQFVLGIDISRDNIENTMDGACVRYLREYYKMWDKINPRALFLEGNSSLSIRRGEAFDRPEHKEIAAAVFSSSTVKPGLGKVVVRAAGIGKDGFHISSCQFAIHYFFGDLDTLHGFMRNVAECTRMGGYFIGTCFDGETVFNRLNASNNGTLTYVHEDDKKEKHILLDIQKKYIATGFPANEGSLGYKINVFMESIGQYIPENLVHYGFLRNILAKYGFELVESFIGKDNSGSKMFDKLYKSYLDTPGKSKLNESEKNISFMNRYFMFKKVREPDEGYLKGLNIGEAKHITVSNEEPPVKEEEEEEEVVEKEEEEEVPEEDVLELRPKEKMQETPPPLPKEEEQNPKQKRSKKVVIEKPDTVPKPRGRPRKLKQNILIGEDKYSPVSDEK